MPTPELVQVEEMSDGLRVRFTCHTLCEENARDLAAALFPLVTPAKGRDLYLDFGAVEFLSSAVLAQLVVLGRKVRAAGGRLVLFSLSPAVSEVLQVSRLIDLLDVRGVPLPPGPRPSSPLNPIDPTRTTE